MAGIFYFDLHKVYRLKGYVTTLSAIVGRTPAQLEQRLGLETGRLKSGFCVFCLTQHVGPRDFISGDQTLFSKGFVYEPEIAEFVHRADQLRSAQLVKFGTDIKADRALLPRLKEEQRQLNVRSGQSRIVKVVPVIQHDPKKKWEQYPDSKISGIRQWELRCEKDMLCVAQLSPGEAFRGL